MEYSDNMIAARIREARGNDSAATHQRHEQRPVLDISGHADIDGNEPTKGAVINDGTEQHRRQPATEATITPSVDGGMYARLAAIIAAEQQAMITQLAAAEPTETTTTTTVH